MNAPISKPVSLLQTSTAEASELKMPKVVCPSCGTNMRLVLVEPLYNGAKSHNRMLFNCNCGIEYWLRDRVANELDR